MGKAAAHFLLLISSFSPIFLSFYLFLPLPFPLLPSLSSYSLFLIDLYIKQSVKIRICESLYIITGHAVYQ